MSRKAKNDCTFVNSCISGYFSYYLSSKERFLDDSIESDPDHLEEHRRNYAHRWSEAMSFWGNDSRWLVYSTQNGKTSLQFRSLLEARQGILWAQEHIFWPLDMVEQKSGRFGWIIKPIDKNRYRPIQRWLFQPTDFSIPLAVGIFRRLQQLHAENITLNGLYRDQVRVDITQGEVCIWPGETAADFDFSGEHTIVCRNGFLTVPNTLSNSEGLERSMQTWGPKRDVFSAAVLAFYLLYHIHPFTGRAFLPLSRQEYLLHIHNEPSFIFDPSGNNCLGVQGFEMEISQLWGATLPNLQELFFTLFTEGFSASDERVWDVEYWIESLLAENVKRKSRPLNSFPYSIMRQYQI